MARDAGVCHVCGLDGADQVDHIVAGDNHDVSNLAPCHTDVVPFCHRYKSSAEGHAAQRKIRALGKMPVEAHPGLL